MEKRGKFKLKGFQLKRRIKETFAMFLSILMVASVISVPVKAEEYEDYSLERGQWFIGGDEISGSENYIRLVFVVDKVSEATDIVEIDPYDSGDVKEDEDGKFYQYGSFTFPMFNPEKKQIGGKALRAVYQLDNAYSLEYGTEFVFTQYDGFKVLYMESAEDDAEPYEEDVVYFYGSGGLNYHASTAPEKEDVIGWSTSDLYVDKNSSGFFVAAGNTIGETDLEELIGDVDAGILTMYPMAERLDTEDDWLVEMDGYTLTPEGEVPSGTQEPTVTMGDNRRDYEFAYQELELDPDTGETVAGSEIDELPEYPGLYRVVLRVDETNTVMSDDGKDIESRGYKSVEKYSDPFIVRGIEFGSIILPDDLEYNGENQNLAEADADYEDRVVFSDAEDGEYSTTVPTGKDAGTYEFWWKAKGDDASYTDDSEPQKVSNTISPKTITGVTWSDEDEFTYTGEALYPEASVSGLVSGDECDPSYSFEGEGLVEGSPINVGDYTVKVAGLSNENYALPSDEVYSKAFSITEADASVEEWPSGNELTYDGTEQELASGGVVNGGAFWYSLSKNGTYAAEVPVGKNVDSYEIWVKVVGDENHTDLSARKINATISPKTVGLNWGETEFEYDGEEHCAEAELTGIADGDSCDVSITGRGINVGTYTATAETLSNSNYVLPKDITKSFQIIPAEVTIETLPEARTLTYDGTNQELIIPGVTSSEFGKIRYRLVDEEGQAETEYSFNVPKGKNAGKYFVGYELVSVDDNHECSASGTVEVTIEKAEITPTVRIEDWTYGQAAKEPELSGNSGNGTVSYSYKLKTAGEDAYTAGLPAIGTSAGKYTLKATVGESDNYKSGEATVDFTIGRASFAPTVAFVDFNYGETPADPVITGNTGGGAVSYAYRLQSATEEEYVSGLPGSTTPAGEYILKATIEETVNYPSAEATTEFTIAKATLGAHVSISNWTYGETANTPSVDKNPESATVKYEYKLKTAAASAYSETVPTDAGEYVVRATIPESTNYNEDVSTADFSIAKASISPSLSMDDWTYGETASTPVVTGNTGNGVVTYAYRLQSASEEGYTSGIPDSTTEAGDYILKASIAETANYRDSETTDEFSILPAELSPSIEIAEWTYGDAPNTPTVYGNIESGTETFQYKAKDDEDSEYTTEVPENAGIYQVRVLIAATANYKEAVSDPTEFTISKADAYIKNETATSLSYTGEEQPLLDSSIEAEGGFLLFALGTNGSEVPIEDVWDEIIPEEVNAGDYYVWIRIIGDDNHNDMAPAVRKVRIEKAGNSLSLPTMTDLTYNAAYQQLLKAGEAEFGTVYYGFEKNGNYSDSVPEGKDAKTYTIWVKVIGDENHADIDPVKATVTIDKKQVGLKWSDLTFKYDGKKHVPTATLTGVISGDSCKVSVSGEASTAGKHTATAEKLTNNNYVLPSSNTTTFTIGTSLPTLKTAPAAKSLTENGDYQELVTAGVAENGTLLYSTSKDNNYSTEIPKGKDAGTYTVWYKVNGNSVDGKKCFDDLDPVSITVTIAKKPDEKKDDDNKVTTLKPGSVSISVSNAIYGGNAPTPVVTSATNDVSKASISYKPAAAPDTAFTGTMPSEVGNYVAVVTLPGNNEYTGCTATCGFSISYMQVPAGAYAIKGTQGVGGWYTSDVTLEPAAGYQVSVGNRGQFTSQPVLLNEANAGASFYIRKTATGEQSAAIQIAALRIDALKPQIHDMETGGTYFTDKKGVLKGTASDKNLDKVLVDGNTVKTESDGNGNVTFDLPSGKRKQKVEVTVVDKAGNESKIEIITAPEWMKDGIIHEGDLFLEADTEYKTPTGNETWTKDGDYTTYMPGISFYADEGDVTFHKH